MRERRSPIIQIRRACLLVMAAGAMTALSGCGNEDTHSVTIRDASHSLEALTPRSTTAASDSYVAQQSEQIIQKLRSVTKSGNDTQKAAANELIARAQLGVAFPKGQTAHLLVTKTQGQIEIARAYYDRLILSRALETAANNYQPGPETAEIEAELTTVAAQVTQAQSAKATVDAAVSSLRAIASTKQAQAQTHRTAESKLRQSVLTTDDSKEAARLMVETQAERRKADALDVEASDLEAQADQRAPESVEIERQIQRFQNQTTLLNDSLQEIVVRSQRSREDAVSAAADAAETHASLASALSALASTYQSELIPATDDAVSSYSQVSSAASQARKVIQSARGINGQAKQAIGDLHWATAEVSASYAILLEMLAQTSPPLSGIGDLTGGMQSASTTSTDQFRLAAAALNAAADSISDQAVSDSIRERANVFSARAGDPVETPAETPDDLGDPAQADPAGEDDSGDPTG